MKFLIAKPPMTPLNFMRSLGYHPDFGGESFSRRLGARNYPRLHIYFKELAGEKLEISLHLDQKKPSYFGQRAHSADYSGDILDQEKERIMATAADLPK